MCISSKSNRRFDIAATIGALIPAVFAVIFAKPKEYFPEETCEYLEIEMGCSTYPWVDHTRDSMFIFMAVLVLVTTVAAYRKRLSVLGYTAYSLAVIQGTMIIGAILFIEDVQ